MSWESVNVRKGQSGNCRAVSSADNSCPCIDPRQDTRFSYQILLYSLSNKEFKSTLKGVIRPKWLHEMQASGRYDSKCLFLDQCPVLHSCGWDRTLCHREVGCDRNNGNVAIPVVINRPINREDYLDVQLFNIEHSLTCWQSLELLIAWASRS